MPSTQFPHLDFFYRFHDRFDHEHQIRDNSNLIAVTRCPAIAPNGKRGTWAFDITDGQPCAYVATTEQLATLCTACVWAECMTHPDADALLATLILQANFAALIESAPIGVIGYDGANVQFYLEYTPSLAQYRRTDPPNYSTGNVLAVFPETEKSLGVRSGGIVYYEALGCAHPEPDHTPVDIVLVGSDYLARCCAPIPEKMARIMHPELFDILDPIHRQKNSFSRLNHTAMPLLEPRDPLADAINTRDSIDLRKKKVVDVANSLPDDAPQKTRSLYTEAATNLQHQRDAANGEVRRLQGRDTSGTS